MENPDAAAEVLNNHDILQAVIKCIGEEKIAVAKQVIAKHFHIGIQIQAPLSVQTVFVVVLILIFNCLFSGHPVFV